MQYLVEDREYMSIHPTRQESYLYLLSPALRSRPCLHGKLLSATVGLGRWRCGDPGLVGLIAARLLYTVQSLAAFLLQVRRPVLAQTKSPSSVRVVDDSISFQLVCRCRAC